MGTSLKVQPFSGLINMVKPDVPRVLINMEAVGDQVHKMGDFFSMAKGFDFNGPENTRDIALLGDLQKTVKELVNAVGWEKEFAEQEAEAVSKLKAAKSEKKDKHKNEKK
jgi:NAD-dependent deacetylase sirtuin 2